MFSYIASKCTTQKLKWGYKHLLFKSQILQCRNISVNTDTKGTSKAFLSVYLTFFEYFTW